MTTTGIVTVGIAERVRELTEARLPFVHATVVRAQEPTSARAGDDAVVLADGSIEGFVGGVCAEGSVRAAALDTLRDGDTLLLRVLPEGTAGFPDTPGALVVVNPCHSGGAIEIFLRPVLPRPRLAVAGTTPIAAAVAQLAAFLDFEVPEAGDFTGVSVAVVAGLGRDEQRAIRLALDAGAAFVALVASHKRGMAVLDDMELTDAERARIHTHVGIDIGARTPAEIAVSILAEIVRAIRVDGLATVPGRVAASGVAEGGVAEGGVAEGGVADAPVTVVDPVCGMTVVVGPGTLHALVDGRDHWFCGTGCLTTFTAA